MSVFGDSELATMREAAEHFMNDSCVLGHHKTTKGTGGQLVDDWTWDAVETPCGVTWGTTTEVWQADKTLAKSQTTIRLPRATLVNVQDHVRITKITGDPVAVVESRVTDTMLGPTALVCVIEAVSP